MTDDAEDIKNSQSATNVMIASYNAAEQAGRSVVPNVAIAAFSPEVFQLIGYPHRIVDASELWRYHDVMQDGRLIENLRLIGKGMDQQFGVIQEAATAIMRFSENNFGFRSAGKDMFSRAIYQYSLIELALTGVPKPWKILEVGPGCGFLGVMLGLSGHSYVALEASQAFWIYQNALFRSVFGPEYTTGLGDEDESRIRHLPWWRFCAEGFELPRLTACTANHMLAEMNASALVYLSGKLARSQSDGFKIIAEDLGLCRYNEEHETLRRLVKSGFSATEVKSRVWVFNRCNGSNVIRRLPTPRQSLRQRLRNMPIAGRAMTKVFELLSRTVRKRTIKAGQIDRRLEKPSSRGGSDLLIKLFEELPDFRSADARFTDGSW